MRYKTDVFTKKELKRLTRLLLKSHVPLIPDRASMNLPVNDFTAGVQCDRCGAFKMDRIYGTWFCKTCGHTSKEAHIAAIRDYFLLFGPEINNLQLRKFLQIDSPDLATRILTSMNLHTTGTTKNRNYFLPTNHFY